jgi:hypothetical protein
MARIEKFDTFQKVSENYEIGLETDDFAAEHPKAVIDRAMEMHKETGEWDLKKAFNEVCKENELSKFEHRRELTYDSLVEVSEEILKQVKAMNEKK